MSNLEKRCFTHSKKYFELIRAAKKYLCSICREIRLKKSERKLGICLHCSTN